MQIDESTIEALEQHIAQISDALEAASNALDGVSDSAPATEELEQIGESADALDEASRDLEEATNAWLSQVEQLQEALTNSMAALQHVLSDLQGHAEAVAQTGSDSLDEAKTALDTTAVQLLGEVDTLIEQAERRLADCVSNFEAGLSRLMSATDAQLVDCATQEISSSIEVLNSTIGELEQVGGDVARTSLRAVKQITDSLDGILQILNSVRPALDAVAAIA